jgi:hypothetical protein
MRGQGWVEREGGRENSFTDSDFIAGVGALNFLPSFLKRRNITLDPN